MDNTLNYGIHGIGRTAREAVDDFYPLKKMSF